jgi:hypothetical protein
MSAPEPRWRWVLPTWLSWSEAELYTSLPRHILRELALSHQIRAQSLYSRIGRPTKLNRYSLDELLRDATQSQQPIYWRTDHS